MSAHRARAPHLGPAHPGCYRWDVRALALDFGTQRIGVALSDPTGVVAQPLETIERGKGGLDAVLARIAELIASYGVAQLVLGLPLHLDGRAGPEAEAVRVFGAELARRTGLPVDYVDERWTSQEAERAMSGAGLKARRRRGRVDPVAASLILQTWLARQAT